MKEIPEGIFLMGSRRGQGNPEERPMHERIVARFYLDETEVTWAAYRACVDAGACRLPRPDDAFCNHRSTGRERHPVNCIDWNDAVAYCAWVGKRLPSEAEWEYAAGGGSEGRRFSWGDADPDRRRACFDHAGGTCPVRSFEAGAFGLFDMSGNVWEWTSSWFSLPPGSSKAGAGAAAGPSGSG
jgi:iron(II)-dependent oxidoreductase